ncbi:MAG: Crp/Fnr family transcriptional regulator [Actinomycetota bacterium]
MGRDVFEGFSGVVPGAIAAGGVKTKAATGGRREDRPLTRHDTDLLAEVPLFSGLSRRHLRRLAEHADVTSFRQGEFVVLQDQPGGTFFVILEGEAKVLRNGRPVGKLEPGDFLGEIALLDGGPRTADVIAATPVTAIRLFKKAFDRLVVEEHGVAAKILAVVARRLRDAERSFSS